MIQDGYSICFNEWALDTRIKNELPFLLIISSLTAKTGECFAGNKYFAGLFNVDESTVSRWLRKLIKLEYITAEYERRGAEVIKRKLRIAKMSIDEWQKCQSTVIKNAKDKNIIYKNNNNNKPTKQDVENYAQSRNRPDLAEKFWDFFNATDWVDSNGKQVKNWKAKFITWESHTPKPQQKSETWWRE